MIKVTTAHKVIAGGTAVAAGTVLLVGVPNDFDPKLMAANAASGLGQFGGFLKATGVLGASVGVLFILMKFDIVKILTVQEGETGLLIRRGKVVLDKKTGLPHIVSPGRYQLHVAVIRHIAIVSNRERYVELGSIPFSVAGVTWVKPLTLAWSIKGDPESLRDALIKVSDGNRFDEKFGALEKAVMKQSIAGLAHAFNHATPGVGNNPPSVDFSTADNEVLKRLNGYGCDYLELLEEPTYLYPEQHGKDGMLAIAKAVENLPMTLYGHVSSMPSAS